jgi:hypothetical protein
VRLDDRRDGSVAGRENVSRLAWFAHKTRPDVAPQRTKFSPRNGAVEAAVCASAAPDFADAQIPRIS